MKEPMLIGTIMEKGLNVQETKSSLAISRLSSEAISLREKYKSPKELLSTYNPSYQFAYTRDLRRAYTGKAPTLGLIRTTFGEKVAESWIEIQINDLSEYCGCQNKLSPAQTEAIGRTILATWGYMKITELMHFFVQFKSGIYGRFYGSVDGLIITSALKEFAKERFDRISRYQQEMEKERIKDEERIRMLAVNKLKRMCAEAGLMLRTFAQLGQEYGLSDEEVVELAWLFKMGYENIRPSHT